MRFPNGACAMTCAVTLLQGCGTVQNLIDGPEIYGGVRTDIYCPNDLEEAVFAMYDLPFSAILDTALIPVTGLFALTRPLFSWPPHSMPLWRHEEGRRRQLEEQEKARTYGKSQSFLRDPPRRQPPRQPAADGAGRLALARAGCAGADRLGRWRGRGCSCPTTRGGRGEGRARYRQDLDSGDLVHRLREHILPAPVRIPPCGVGFEGFRLK